MTEATALPKGSIYKHMIRGSVWALTMRWSARAVGVVSVVVLARLLTPADFGIVAMGSLVLGLLSTFTDFSVGALVIREKEASREICDTAWTVDLILGFLVALMLLLCAPFAVEYFDEPRVLSVVHVLAIVAILQGFRNIGISLIRKELEFAKDFRFHLYVRLLRFVATMTLAFIWRDYWALVVGGVVAAFVSVILSYQMHSYRPRLSLAKVRLVFSFGSSMLLSNIARYFNNRIDTLVVGGVGSTTMLGGYNVVSELSKMVTVGIVVPINRGLFPNYAKVAHDEVQLRGAYLHSLRAIALLCFPLGIGLSLVAEDALVVVLGAKWLEFVPLLEWLALYALLDSILVALMSQILIVIEREWLATKLRAGRLALLAPVVIIAGVVWGVEAIPPAATLTAATLVPIVGYIVARTVGITLAQMAGAFWRPLIAAIFMAGVVVLLQQILLHPALNLAIQVPAGALAYCSSLAFLWWVAGRPDGAERVVVSVVMRKLGLAAPA